ncbi:LSU ribosomal protein L7AE [Anaerobranca californiensis DSM 14826]|jgi:large subunit ribosomal protein L7A|uniref:LSU ribosomal protein L7AE n=1 Tax=Anaerobranca californiensis DSM 14826 TaxID=1120989 RepID=A0A1M6RGN4_9FIRM|nr:ribosomal L7Ae/L30e/S12e/Gadd45 family protein [Anaerobranca californiensis]SHK31622.1 LSU ribosomal protein L7AE [Anaerobranca californiensis DSM 14826]
MAIDKLATATEKTVGFKQTKKAIEKGKAKLVFLAKDADDHIFNPLLELCQQKGVVYEIVDTMEQLGKASGIQVGAAAAAVIEE